MRSRAVLAAARGRGRSPPAAGAGKGPAAPGSAAPSSARLSTRWKQQPAGLEGSRETDRTHVQITVLQIDDRSEWSHLNVIWSFRVPEDIGFHEIVWVTEFSHQKIDSQVNKVFI